MLNGDVLSDMDLSAQIAAHGATVRVGTLALVRSRTRGRTGSCAETTTSGARVR